MKIQCFHSSSNGNLYGVSDGETQIMIECGVVFKEIQKCFNFNLSSLAGCLITHCHNDHAISWKDVSKYTPVFMLKETAETLKASGYNINIYTPLETFVLGTLFIMPIPAKHDVPCSSFIIRSKTTNEIVLFATDTAYLRHVITNVNYAMVECNFERHRLNKSVDSGYLEPAFRDRILASHMGFDTTLGILTKLNPNLLKEIHILHLSNSHANAENVKRTIEQKLGKPVYIAGE